jgi:hypothetical protein
MEVGPAKLHIIFFRESAQFSVDIWKMIVYKDAR